MVDVVIRAYDLGGYGDIAGALRVTDYFSRQGIDVGILPDSKGAKEKLLTLEPNCSWIVNQEAEFGAVLVDVAGHYLDNRSSGTSQPPHFFVEDMDNTSDRTKEVPLYLKTGFVKKPLPDNLKITGLQAQPLFYRPYKEHDLPTRSAIDPLEIITKHLEAKTKLTGAEKEKYVAEVFSALNGIDNVGIAHYQPGVGSQDILESAYLEGVISAAKNSNKKYAVCLFVNSGIEKRLRYLLHEEGQKINLVSANGVKIIDSKAPYIILLGPTPQDKVSKLFLASNIPPLVTGDLSLSDQLYFLLAKDGPGFFYDCAGWKAPTQKELDKLLCSRLGVKDTADFCSIDGIVDGIAEKLPDISLNDFVLFAKTFSVWAGFGWVDNSSAQRNEKLDRFTRSKMSYVKKCTDKVVKVLIDGQEMSRYTTGMRRALSLEIKERFGKEPVVENGRIIDKSPFLFQDCASIVVKSLLENKEMHETAEKRRQELICLLK